MIHLLGTICIVAGAVASSGFVALYTISARWYRSEEGWHLMTFTGLLALVLIYTSYRNLTATAAAVPLGVDVARLAIFASVAASLSWRVWMLYRIQIRAQRARRRVSAERRG